MYSGLWKVFIYLFTGRRNFWPLMSLYYLTLPGSLLAHLWVFMSLEMLTSFLIEIPSGYISDRIGYKKTLVLGKIFLIVSTLCFVVWKTFVWFALASVFYSLAMAFKSWTLQAFVHDSLETDHKWDSYAKIMSKIRGDVSLFSTVFLVWFPFLYTINALFPFIIALAIDVFGLWSALFLKEPISIHHKGDEKKVYRSMLSLLKEFWASKKFLLLAVLLAVSSVLYLSQINYKEPFLIDSGFPVALIGFVVWCSRFFWFLIGRAIAEVKNKIVLADLIVIDFSLLWCSFLLFALVPMDRYVIGFLFSLMMGYFYAREPLYTHQLINLLPDKQYKATFLSIHWQLKGLLWIAFPLGIGAVMFYWYTLWFGILGILYLIAGLCWVTLRKSLNKK